MPAVFTSQLGTAATQLGLVELGALDVSLLPAILATPPGPLRQAWPKRSLAPSPLDILLDGLPYKLYVEETTKGGEAAAHGAAYMAEEQDPLLPRIGSGKEIQYSDFPAKDVAAVAEDNWIAGIAPIRLNVLDQSYWLSQGVDARRPNQLILQPQGAPLAFVSQPTGPPLRILDFAGGTFLIAGDTVWRLGVSPMLWNPVLTAPPGAIFSDLVVYNNLLLACASGSTTDAGTATYAATTLTDPSKTWTINQWAGRVVKAGGQTNTVLSNTATALTFDQAWLATPTAGSAYTIDSHIAYYSSSDGVTWSRAIYAGANQDAPKADFFVVVRSQLWKAVKPNKVYSVVDPTAPSGWTSTPTQVGDQARAITGLAAYTLDLAVAKEDGLWTVDRGGNDFPIVPEIKSVANAGNGKNIKPWRTGLLFPVRNGVFRYDGSRLLSVGLDRYRAAGPQGGPVILQPVDVAPYMNECFVVHQPVNGPPAIYVDSLFEAPWRWHTVFYQPGALPTCAAVVANVNATPTLVVGRLAAGVYDTVALRLPAATDNPLDDVYYRYASTGNFFTTEKAPLPDQMKSYLKVRVRCLQGSGAATVAMAYAADQNIDTQTYAPMVGVQAQPTQSALFQEWFFSLDQQPVQARALMLRLTLATTDPTQTPVVKHIAVHYKLRNQPTSRFKMQLLLEEHTAGHDWQLDPRGTDDQLFELISIRLKDEPVIFQGLLGDQRLVYVEQVDHRLLEKQPGATGTQAIRVVATVHLLEFVGSYGGAGSPADPL